MAGANAGTPYKVGTNFKQYLGMLVKCLVSIVLLLAAAFSPVAAQQLTRQLVVAPGDFVEVVNRHGRVKVTAGVTDSDQDAPIAAGFSATGTSLSSSEVNVQAVGGKTRLTISPSAAEKRIDLALTLPAGVRIRIETSDGEISLRGNFNSIVTVTETGTIAADLPPGKFEYNLLWTASRPRVLSEFPLQSVKERPGGKFLIKGKLEVSKNTSSNTSADSPDMDLNAEANGSPTGIKKEKNRDSLTSLHFTTARGIVLLNIPVSEVPSNLRERQLTRAAKAIVMSGDAVLTEAIRRASPKHFSEFEKTLPPFRKAPGFAARNNGAADYSPGDRSIMVRVIDRENRAIAGLRTEDFEITENNLRRDIVSVTPITSPINVVLLLDVSGSVENYVNFIRKAARNFVETVEKGDRVSIVLFNDDIQVLSNFSSDKAMLSQTLDSFDAGGSTAYYDALGFVLSDTIRQLGGRHVAIVALTDGDDNRSFLPFESLFGAIEESGAIIYPLYVPSSLIAATPQNDFNAALDPLRARFIALTSKAQAEGKRLAEISGGIYFPIMRLSQIQKAYNDIVSQMRTAYRITYRSEFAKSEGNGTAPRLRVRVSRPNAYVQLFPIPGF